MADQTRDPIKKLDVLQDLIAQLHAEHIHVQQTSPRTLNLFTASGITRREQVHSNLIAHLIKGDQSHRHPEYGVAFVRMIYEKHLKRPFVEPQWLTVETEKWIWAEESEMPRRLDIYIESEQFILVIENKPGFKDENAQLRDYYLWLKREAKDHNKEYLLAYLTPFGDTPNPNSLSKIEKSPDIRKKEKKVSLDALAKKIESELILLSYKKDILLWLKSLEVQRDTEQSLEFSIQQYIEALEVLCELRREDAMDFTTIANKLQTEANKNKLTPQDLYRYKELAKELEKGYSALLYIRFLEALSEALKNSVNKRHQNNVFYTHGQTLYERQADWIQAIMKDWKDIGIAVKLEENMSIGLEGNSFSEGKPNLYFGVMLHGVERENPHLLPDFFPNSGDYELLEPEPAYWGDHIQVDSIIKTLYNDSQAEAIKAAMFLFRKAEIIQ